ncbi:MAG: cytochrome c oxidase subunit II [Bosea sp. (in: a-proteobacteria)]
MKLGQLAGLGVTALLAATLALASPALAAVGAPTPWQMDLPAPASDNMAFIKWFHDWLVVMCVVISVFVLGLLLYAMWRFSEKRNPVASRTTHHTGLEVAWTLIPILILVAIAIPSFTLLKQQLDLPKADITLKITGKQWFWTWDYPKDQGGFAFDQLMIPSDDWKRDVAAGKINAAEAPRLLAVDNEAVVPIGKIVRVQVTAADVIHKFAMPAFGLKIDAIPGRLNETWFKADKEGIFYGQCSFICGQNHSYMPMAIRVVSQEKYAAWLADAKKKFAAKDDPSRMVAGQPAQTAN